MRKRHLSFPKIISGRIGGCSPARIEWRQWRQIVFSGALGAGGFSAGIELLEEAEPPSRGSNAAITRALGPTLKSLMRQLKSGRCITTVDLGRGRSRLHSRERLDDRVMVHRSRWHEPRVPSLEVQSLPFQIEPCAARDYVPHRLVVPRCWGLELAPWVLDPEAHRNALAGDEILLAISPRGEVPASTFLIVVSGMVDLRVCRRAAISAQRAALR